MLGISILEQTPFTGLEEVPRPEDIASALHLKRADVVSNWETQSGVKGFLAKFLMDQAQQFWDNLDFQEFEDILALPLFGQTRHAAPAHTPLNCQALSGIISEVSLQPVA